MVAPTNSIKFTRRGDSRIAHFHFANFYKCGASRFSLRLVSKKLRVATWRSDSPRANDISKIQNWMKILQKLRAKSSPKLLTFFQIWIVNDPIQEKLHKYHLSLA